MSGQRLTRESDAPRDVQAKRPIPGTESDLAARLNYAIGDMPYATFARRCGIGGTTLRKYVLQGAQPSADRLVAMADVAGVRIEWLAAGRGPMKRSANTSESVPPWRFDDLRRLQASIEACEIGLRQANIELKPDKYAELILAAYELMAEWERPDSRSNVVRLIRAAA